MSLSGAIPARRRPDAAAQGVDAYCRHFSARPPMPFLAHQPFLFAMLIIEGFAVLHNSAPMPSNFSSSAAAPLLIFPARSNTEFPQEPSLPPDAIGDHRVSRRPLPERNARGRAADDTARLQDDDVNYSNRRR